MKKNIAVVILAAGEGTRMKSVLPKVLHALEGKPLVQWVLSAIKPLKPKKIVAVVGHKKEQVQTALKNDNVVFVEQKKQLGSGHALLQAEKALGRFSGTILVLSGDVPLIRTNTLRTLLAAHDKRQNSVTILSAIISKPFSYGRICRTPAGNVHGIVEEKDATPEERAITEINSGIYCFSSPAVWPVLHKIKPNNVKKEYYLTDVVTLFNNQGKRVGACPDAVFEEIVGVNSRVELAKAADIVRQRINTAHMKNGVAIIDPQHTYIGSEVRIGNDTCIYPGCVIEGRTTIGSSCTIGPFSVIRDSIIHNHVEVVHSHVNQAHIDDHAKIGPFSHLRPGTRIKARGKVGNFSETKNAVVGFGSKVNHLTYVGDAYLGKNVNVGAGTITCNYDGVKKHKTIIGDDSFVGSNVNFVAPVKVGSRTLIAAGSTITDNVPSRALAIARARQVIKTKRR